VPVVRVKSTEGAEATIIDGGGIGTVVKFSHGEGAGSVLEGFTLTNGTGMYINYNYMGGAIYCSEASPTVNNNRIVDNSADSGGGICCSHSSATFSDNFISNNEAVSGGGAVYCASGSGVSLNENMICNNSASSGGGVYCISFCPVVIRNNTIINNTAMAGGGISCEVGHTATIVNNWIAWNSADYGGGINALLYCPDIINNTITENVANINGGGISCSGSLPTVTNTILWNNSAPSGPQISVTNSAASPSHFTISYSDVRGGEPDVPVDPGSVLYWGSGMIDSDPMFVNSLQGDYHLTSASPCKDTGDGSMVSETTDFEQDPRIAFGNVDMGADEFYNHLYCTGDFTPNGEIQGKVIGPPNTWPVGLFIGSGVRDIPLQHKWGLFYLELPWMVIPLVPISGNGTLILPETLPATPAPYDIPMQALIGNKLSNLFVLEVR